MKKRLIYVLSAVSLSVFVAFFLSGCKQRTPSAAINPKPGANQSSQTVQKEEVRIGPYTYRSYANEEGLCETFELLKDGKKVYSVEETSACEIVTLETKEGKKLSSAGRDIAGQGVPGLIVEDFSGGAHCCYTYHVFFFGIELKTVTIDGHHDAFEFKDIDGDGSCEAIGRDWSFAYWHTPFSNSPAPQVILRYRDGAFKLATDLMRQPGPSDAELQKKAAEIRGNIKKTGDPESNLLEVWGPEMWGYMLDLIYSANGEKAFQFLEIVWLPGEPYPLLWPNMDAKKIRYLSRDGFAEEFRAQLAGSPYWKDVKALNQWK